NGKRDAYTEPNQPDDATKDRRIGLGLYGIAYSPLDGSIWGSNIGHPGWVIRVQLGSNPSETALAEVYKVPPPGYGMRGFDVDRQGRAWVTLAAAASPASTAAGAEGVSMDRGRRRGTCVPRAGPSIRSRAPRLPARTVPPRGRTTPGSTSTTSWASAGTRRSAPAISRTRSMR